MKIYSKTLTFIYLFLLVFTGLTGATGLAGATGLTGASSLPETGHLQGAKGKWASLNGLIKVHSHLLSNGHIVRLEFNKPVTDWLEPIFYEKSVQLDFPGAFIDPAKKSFSTESFMLSKVFASQYDGETLRVRFHVKPGIDDIKERFKLVSQGRFIIVRFDTAYAGPVIASAKIASSNTPKAKIMGDDDLAEFLSRASEKMQRQEEKFSSAANKKEPVVKEETPSTEIKIKRAGMGVAPLIDQIKKAALSNSNEEKKDTKKSKTKITTKENRGFSLKDSRPTGKPMEMIPSGLKMISMFAVVLGLMFLIFFGFKKYVLKNTAFGGGNKLVSVLGTWFLGPKKNIVLVEVAGEVLVLGISQDHITLLSSITDEEKIEEIKNAGGKGKKGLGLNSAPAGEKKDRIRSVAAQAAGQFSSYLNKFSKSQGAKEQTVMDAKDQILQKIGRMKTARA